MKIHPIHLPKLVGIYRRTTMDMYQQLLDVEKSNKLYHNFFVKIRLELFELSKKDKKYIPLFKRVDKFIKKWK